MSAIPTGEEVVFPGSVCFGCSPTNPRALHMRFFRQGDEVVSVYRAGEHLCGAPGIVHGGIIATLVDEVSCAVAVFVRGLRVVTGELTVRYVKPCPVERDIEIRARIVEERPRYLIVECVVSLDGVEHARSNGRFFPISGAD